MGLTATAKGLTAETEYCCGYITYGWFLMELAEVAYDEKCSEIYNKMFKGLKITDEDVEYWNNHCNDDLDILLFHGDCEGKLTPKECRKVYNAMKFRYAGT